MGVTREEERQNYGKNGQTICRDTLFKRFFVMLCWILSSLAGLFVLLPFLPTDKSVGYFRASLRDLVQIMPTYHSWFKKLLN
jgi:hypothetical protein